MLMAPPARLSTRLSKSTINRPEQRLLIGPEIAGRPDFTNTCEPNRAHHALGLLRRSMRPEQQSRRLEGQRLSPLAQALGYPEGPLSLRHEQPGS